MKIIPIYFLVTLNILAVIILWIAAVFSTLSPNVYGWLSLSGYALPFLVIINIAFLALWVFIKKRFILISFIGLVVAYKPIILYCPLNSSTAENNLPKNLITILSYNTSNWGTFTTSPDKVSTNEEKMEHIVSMLKENDADILVLQESALSDYSKPVSSMYEYADTISNKNNKGITLTILSKYPIIKKEKINIESNKNACGAFWLDVNGKEVIVINAHLEVMRFSMKERSQFSTIVHGNQKDKDSIRSTSHTLIGKIYKATKIRARQAETIAEFINSHNDTPIIIAGDFNDIPNSYVHSTILEALAKDGDEKEEGYNCYAHTGFGPGYTFKHFGIRVRIDNIMCSPHFTPYNCHIIPDINTSDHQPIVCKLYMK